MDQNALQKQHTISEESGCWSTNIKKHKDTFFVSLSNSLQNIPLWYILSSVLLHYSSIFSLLTKNWQGWGVRLTFKSWHMGREERAAMILHADSGSPYGHHVSIYVVIQLMDECYCWVQRLSVSLVSTLLYFTAYCKWSVTVWFQLALYFDASCIVYFLTHYLSNGCLHRAPGALMAWVFQVTCFEVMMK